MARPRKRLIDVVRDGSFRAREDEHLLLARVPLPWPGLEDYRLRAFTANGDVRTVSLELEQALRQPDGITRTLGSLQVELRKLGPPGSYKRLAGFARRYFRHYAGPEAGKPFVFARFQADFLREFTRQRKDGQRFYSVGLWLVPKGNGKTPTAAVLGTEALVSQIDAPQVFNVAGSKDQADRCHSFAKRNIEDGPLSAWLTVSNEMIRCAEHRGEYAILSSDGDLSAGINPSAFVADELWNFLYRKQRESWNSGVEGLIKRAPHSWALGITTAGYTKDSILGERYDAAIQHPGLELRNDGFLQVLRDEASGFLFWCHGIPDGADVDIEDPAIVRAVNPAPWIDPRAVIALLHQPGADENDWRRLHCNQWTKTKRAWLGSSGIWGRLRSDAQIPEGAEITIGVDCARTHDTTSVSWEWVTPEGHKVTRAHVWSARKTAPHHTLVEGEMVPEEIVEPFIYALARRYRIRGIACDPRYFNTEAGHLTNKGFIVVKVEPWSKAMGNAVVAFEKDVLGGKIEHDGDRVVSLHLDAIDAERRPDGSKKIGKRSNDPIDAGMALVLANYLTTIELPVPVVRSWRPALASWEQPSE